MTPAEARLRRRIAAEGPISVADYMAEANAHYYATRDPFGAAGDFTTAPEISQMFGELVGVWLADLWQRAGRPENAHYVELGPGRGTLAADALRSMSAAGLAPDVHLVETSPVLRSAQAERLPQARWHEAIDTLPDQGPLLIVANEFFDALPVEQFDAADNLLSVRLEEDRFVRTGEVDYEIRYEPSYDIARRLARQGGAALIVDYGYLRPRIGEPGYFGFRNGDTLQAVSRHRFADPWKSPGAVDLTAHVDFVALEEAAWEADVRWFGTIRQGQWLTAMGIEHRAEALCKASPQHAAEIEAARHRLTSSEEMGELFKVLAFVAPAWPEPAGF